MARPTFPILPRSLVGPPPLEGTQRSCRAGPTRVEVAEFFESDGAALLPRTLSGQMVQMQELRRALLESAPSCWLRGRPAGREAPTERGRSPCSCIRLRRSTGHQPRSMCRRDEPDRARVPPRVAMLLPHCSARLHEALFGHVPRSRHAMGQHMLCSPTPHTTSRSAFSSRMRAVSSCLVSHSLLGPGGRYYHRVPP